MTTTKGKLPSGVITLLDAEMKPPNSTVSVMGVLVDFMPTVRSRGTDFTTVFGLLDPDFKSYDNEKSGCKARFFDKKIEDAPKFTGHGDVVLLRNARRSAHPSAVLLKNYATQVIIFPAAVLAAWTAAGSRQVNQSNLDHVLISKGAEKPNADEYAYAKYLYEWKTGNLQQQDPAPATQLVQSIAMPAMRDKFSLLRDARAGNFVDIIGEVVKIWPGTPATLYVTDYSENKDFYSYSKNESDNFAGGVDGDPYGYTGIGKGWQGPPGKYTLQISLWQPHCTWVSQQDNLREKHTVYIRNIHMKTSESSGILEGKLHQDRLRPEEVDIRKYHNNNDAKFLDFLNRRAAFQEAFSPKKVEKSPQKKSKGQRKKERARLKLAKEGKADAQPVQPVEPTVVTKRISNKNVACNNPDFPTTSFSYILNDDHRKYTTPDGKEITLPFINRRCKIRARVVDYFPPDIRDFTCSLDDLEYNDVQKSQSSVDVTLDLMSSEHRNPWEWAFFLLLEDVEGPAPPAGQTRPQLRVVVPHLDAEFLHKLKACDLRREEKILDLLREKMFILWGDLEEIKSAGEFETKKNSSQAFDCWVSEYGIQTPAGGWERMFKMEQTTIQ